KKGGVGAGNTVHVPVYPLLADSFVCMNDPRATRICLTAMYRLMTPTPTAYIPAVDDPWLDIMRSMIPKIARRYGSREDLVVSIAGQYIAGNGVNVTRRERDGAISGMRPAPGAYSAFRSLLQPRSRHALYSQGLVHLQQMVQ